MGAASGAAGGAAVGTAIFPGVGTAIGAGVGAIAGLFGAKSQSKAATKSAQIQSDSANRAAELLAAAADKALAYTKQQDALARQDAEASRRGNYDQWAAREGRIGQYGDLLGLQSRQTPGYVPLAPSGAPSGTTTAGAMLGSGSSSSDQQGLFNSLFPGESLSHEMLLSKEAELGQAGIKVLRNASGRAGKIQLPNGAIVDVVLGGEAGANKKQWLTGGGSAPATAGRSPYVTTANSLLAPQGRSLTTPALQAPVVQPYMPQPWPQRQR